MVISVSPSAKTNNLPADLPANMINIRTKIFSCIVLIAMYLKTDYCCKYIMIKILILNRDSFYIIL